MKFSMNLTEWKLNDSEGNEMTIKNQAILVTALLSLKYIPAMSI